jgi:cytochrome P450
MDELNALPYLDAVVRETLRVHAPVPATMRVAAQDDIVPLGTPFVDRKGRETNVIESVHFRRSLFMSMTLISA